jgi:hypothetical protein
MVVHKIASRPIETLNVTQTNMRVVGYETQNSVFI